LGYLANSGAKFYVLFLVGVEISRLSRLVFESWRETDRQTDRRQTRRPFHKTLTLTVCKSNNSFIQ